MSYRNAQIIIYLPVSEHNFHFFVSQSSVVSCFDYIVCSLYSISPPWCNCFPTTSTGLQLVPMSRYYCHIVKFIVYNTSPSLLLTRFVSNVNQQNHYVYSTLSKGLSMSKMHAYSRFWRKPFTYDTKFSSLVLSFTHDMISSQTTRNTPVSAEEIGS